MIRSFMVGNLLIGLFMAGVSIAVFGAFHLPSFLVGRSHQRISEPWFPTSASCSLCAHCSWWARDNFNRKI
jgi:hypothetical protein